jgi:hypothetical protein
MSTRRRYGIGVMTAAACNINNKTINVAGVLSSSRQNTITIKMAITTFGCALYTLSRSISSENSKFHQSILKKPQINHSDSGGAMDTPFRVGFTLQIFLCCAVMKYSIVNFWTTKGGLTFNRKNEAYR